MRLYFIVFLLAFPTCFSRANDLTQVCEGVKAKGNISVSGFWALINGEIYETGSITLEIKKCGTTTEGIGAAEAIVTASVPQYKGDPQAVAFKKNYFLRKYGSKWSDLGPTGTGTSRESFVFDVDEARLTIRALAMNASSRLFILPPVSDRKITLAVTSNDFDRHLQYKIVNMPEGTVVSTFPADLLRSYNVFAFCKGPTFDIHFIGDALLPPVKITKGADVYYLRKKIPEGNPKEPPQVTVPVQGTVIAYLESAIGAKAAVEFLAIDCSALDANEIYFNFDDFNNKEKISVNPKSSKSTLLPDVYQAPLISGPFRLPFRLVNGLPADLYVEKSGGGFVKALSGKKLELPFQEPLNLYRKGEEFNPEYPWFSSSRLKSIHN